VLAERERFRRVMCKTKPVSTWNCDKEYMYREHNFINRIDTHLTRVLEKDTKNPARFWGS